MRETAESEACTHCPHLVKEMQACIIRPDGIYIPPQVDFQTYCLTDSYKHCPTYGRYCLMEKHPINAPATKNHMGRRHFERIPEKHKVLIQTCDSIGTVTGNFSEQAMTLDYSPGGMHIIIDREIPTDSLLRFDFGFDFVAPQLQGIAQICWRRKLEDRQQGLEAGLAFKDHFSQAVLSVQSNF